MSADWQQLCLVLPASEIETAEALLRLAGAAAIDLSSSDDAHALHEPAPGTTPLWPAVAIRALFAANLDLQPLVDILRHQFAGDAPICVQPLENARWRDSLLRLPETKLIGQRLVLGGPSTDPVPGRQLLRLHRGLAFGTGEHPTTALCLEWIERELPRDLRVLDYGSGSGVLALAALMLGAVRAWAVDIEPQALAATLANAELNGCEDRLWVGPPERLPDVPVDLVMANILLDTLLGLANEFSRRLVPGGILVASGLLESQAGAFVTALDAKFEDFVVVSRDGWSAVSARRTTARP